MENSALLCNTSMASRCTLQCYLQQKGGAQRNLWSNLKRRNSQYPPSSFGTHIKDNIRHFDIHVVPQTRKSGYTSTRCSDWQMKEILKVPISPTKDYCNAIKTIRLYQQLERPDHGSIISNNNIILIYLPHTP